MDITCLRYQSSTEDRRELWTNVEHGSGGESQGRLEMTVAKKAVALWVGESKRN